jgi:hypothetical protein
MRALLPTYVGGGEGGEWLGRVEPKSRGCKRRADGRKKKESRARKNHLHGNSKPGISVDRKGREEAAARIQREETNEQIRVSE